MGRPRASAPSRSCKWSLNVSETAAGASLSNALGSELVLGVPVGRGFRDLMKLAPGVQYTEDQVRGPSAGGSGQDNTYRFDGADLSLPLFGTLSAEPANHDIEQVVFERGGADAVGFNRSGGFAMDSKARSGTDRLRPASSTAPAQGAGGQETQRREARHPPGLDHCDG